MIVKLLCSLALVTVLPVLLVSASAQQQQPQVNGTSFNTKYLAMKNVEMVQQSNGFSTNTVAISGTVENNSSRQVYFVQVVSVLYDQRGNIITTGVGLPQLGTLKPGEHSAFSITISIPINEAVGRFLVIPGGNFY